MNMSDSDVAKYLKAPPPPRTRHCTAPEVNAAVAVLEEAAAFATRQGLWGERWTPGLSIAVVHRPTSQVLHFGYGVKRLDDPTSTPGPDTLFPCASVSKPVSTTLIVDGMVGEPKWDEVVYQDNEREHPYKLAHAAGSTTLRQWLSHLSGLPDHAGDLIEDMSPSMPRDQLLRNIMAHQTGIQPGEHRYTNLGFTMGCLGAARGIAKTDWESFSTDALKKLGMNRSTYVFTSAFDREAGDRVIPHRGSWLLIPTAPLSEDRLGWSWRMVDREHERNPTRQAPAASLLSSAADMATFLGAHLDKRFGHQFPERSPNPKGYSLGWNVLDYSGEQSFRNVGLAALNAYAFDHSGAFTLGAATCVRFDPDMGVGVAVLTNGEPAGVPEILVRIFFKHLYGQPVPDSLKTSGGGLDYAALLRAGRDLMVNAIDAKKIENAERYRGTARQPIPDLLPQGLVFRGHSAYYGCDVVIEREGDDVFLSMGEQVNGRPFWRFPIRCYDRYDSGSRYFKFVYETTGENEVGTSGVELNAGDGFGVTSIHDEWLNQEPAGSRQGSGVGVIYRSH
jgi:CubicO group peptidase (beta-lactamase class C family)